MKKHRVIAALALAGGLAVSSAQAEGHYVPGVEGLQGASVPPPGFYYLGYLVNYNIDDFRAPGTSSNLPGHNRGTVTALANRFVWISQYKLLGADYGMEAIVPVMRPSLRLSDLEGMPLILYPNVPLRGLAQEVTDAFRAEGVPLRVEQEVQDVVTAVALVAGGFGCCITTRSATSLRLPGVTYRPLRSRHLSDIELSCLYRSDDPSPVLGAFLDVVRAFAQVRAAAPG